MSGMLTCERVYFLSTLNGIELIDCLKRGRLKVGSLGLLSFSILPILVSLVFCYYAKGEAHY